MSSTINSTGGSTIMADEATYTNSKRTKQLLYAVDKLLNEGEHKFAQAVSRSLIKPLKRRVKKVEFEPFSSACNNLIDEWRLKVQESVNDLFSESDLKQKLYTLDKLAESEKARNGAETEAWRTIGIPTVDMRDYGIVRSLEHRERLVALFKEMKTEIDHSKADIEAGRVEIEKETRAIATMAQESKALFKAMKANSTSNEKLKEILEKVKSLELEDE